MDVSDNIVIERSVLNKIIGYLINHYNDTNDKQYRGMINFMIVYLKLLSSR